ncbi:hypothetical protein F383_33224 [Gossypium arboreum]|uniref:Uncharacterized protein n=1 Tax=Gossypium arboreum TaxID=29729 RepID=A0A0B0PKB3_GOSAR|nr:hypothetical protein F383_33224 [Gossypium arboreum]
MPTSQTWSYTKTHIGSYVITWAFRTSKLCQYFLRYLIFKA